jgi:predicted enzyme related to lactoylglutathione lyase
MPRPVHFEIHAGDPERASAFYTSVFGWVIKQWGEHPYWIVQTGEGPGIDGGLVPRRGPEPSDDTPVAAFPVTIDVPDLDATAVAVERAGGRVVMEKGAIPTIGWLAYCKDTEGNIFGLMQADPSAA